VVREPLPPDTGDFRSLWENITNDRVENPLKVGGNARGQRCKDNHDEVLTKPVQNFTQFATLPKSVLHFESWSELPACAGGHRPS